MSNSRLQGGRDGSIKFIGMRHVERHQVWSNESVLFNVILLPYCLDPNSEVDLYGRIQMGEVPGVHPGKPTTPILARHLVVSKVGPFCHSMI